MAKKNMDTDLGWRPRRCLAHAPPVATVKALEKHGLLQERLIAKGRMTKLSDATGSLPATGEFRVGKLRGRSAVAFEKRKE